MCKELGDLSQKPVRGLDVVFIPSSQAVIRPSGKRRSCEHIPEPAEMQPPSLRRLHFTIVGDVMLPREAGAHPKAIITFSITYGRIQPGQFLFSVEPSHAAPKAREDWGMRVFMRGENPSEGSGIVCHTGISEHQRAPAGILCQPNTTHPHWLLP